jgi:hypothetical protein
MYTYISCHESYQLSREVVKSHLEVVKSLHFKGLHGRTVYKDHTSMHRWKYTYILGEMQ